MDIFKLPDLIKQRQDSNNLYLEFIRHPSLSVGLYELPAGGIDSQKPHTEDEVYYVVKGRGMIRVGEEDRAVSGGVTVFVAAGVDHRFHTISEDLTILVFFAPAEHSNKK
ncbi:MAG: cupin domain-containing protein [Chloroflexi bacterium]|nr:cupin domain-containing protein [Chloroflexota bacterium]MBI5349314.1 cupin domain-containing protein [Chloroflexota bacterium]